MVVEVSTSTGQLEEYERGKQPYDFHKSYNTTILGMSTSDITYASLLYTLYGMKYMATCRIFTGWEHVLFHYHVC